MVELFRREGASEFDSMQSGLNWRDEGVGPRCAVGTRHDFLEIGFCNFGTDKLQIHVPAIQGLYRDAAEILFSAFPK